MKKIPESIVKLLKDQGYVIVSTLDKGNDIHCSAKGVVEVKKDKVYLIDLYKRVTYINLQRNPTLSITAVDEHQFIGFTLKGKASIVNRARIKDEFIKQWERKVIKRMSKRIVKNVKRDRSSKKHPESRLPLPEYLIEMSVEQIVDLTPSRLKESF